MDEPKTLTELVVSMPEFQCCTHIQKLSAATKLQDFLSVKFTECGTMHSLDVASAMLNLWQDIVDGTRSVSTPLGP